MKTLKLPGGKECLRTKRCFGDDCRGEDVTRASEFADLISNSVRRFTYGSAFENPAFGELKSLASDPK